MKTLLSITALLVCVACAGTKMSITSYDHGKPIGTFETHTFLYGKQTVDCDAFGIVVAVNLDVGAKIFAGLVKDLVSAYVTGDVLKAREITSQMASAGATKAQVAQIDAAAKTKAAEINAGTTGKAIDNKLFAPEATPFTQPPPAG